MTGILEEIQLPVRADWERPQRKASIQDSRFSEIPQDFSFA